MKPVGLKTRLLEQDLDHEEAMGAPNIDLFVRLLLCKC